MNNAAEKVNNFPPMLQQYLDYKERYADCFLFFQVGDFYEIFFNDAVQVSKALNLNLTSRDKNNPDPIPMCGVPVGVVDNYIDRLVAAGYSVAVVSQVQSGASNNRQPVERRLERVITPGIRILGNSDQDYSEHLLVSVSIGTQSGISIAIGDIQSGRLVVREELNEQELVSEILRLTPSEIVFPKFDGERKIDRRTSWVNDIERALPAVSVKFRVFSEGDAIRSKLSAIRGFSALSVSAKRAVKLFADYVEETIVNLALPIKEIIPYRTGETMIIDSTARANLELLRNLRQGNEEHTLVKVIDSTLTPGGARLLRRWIAAPLVSVDRINHRLDCIEALISASNIRSELRSQMKYIGDLERIATRIELKVVTPRELGVLREALKLVPVVKEILSNKSFSDAKRILELSNLLTFPKEASLELFNALSDTLPPTLAHGGAIRDGYNSEIDRLRLIKTKGKSWIAELEAQEKERTGIGSLKIKYNNVLGYFIEITSVNINKVPSDYVRRQSTANTERFTTELLRKREEEVVSAEERELKLEKELFEELRQKLLPEVDKLRVLSEIFSEIDCFQSLAQVGEREDYRRPVVDDSLDFIIEDGRHPVLSQILQNKYVPTSIEIKESRKNFLIITGPNMGGKSTYLRQAALIAVLSQIGSFVPARKVRIGVVDRIFARLGASDNLSEGESTFMVEMREAAHIIAHASERSLLLIDEIGRGTATADGLAIAQAILEWIIFEIKARSLFATHFHELTDLDKEIPAISNLSVGSYEERGEVIFTHHILSGPANRSYGIEVAKLAGLPTQLLKRAQSLLLNSLDKKGDNHMDTRQISLFARPAQTVSIVKSDNNSSVNIQQNELLARIRRKIDDLDLNTVTPLHALVFLNSIKDELKND